MGAPAKTLLCAILISGCGSVANDTDAAAADGPTSADGPAADAGPDARPAWVYVNAVGGTILGSWGDAVGSGSLIYFAHGDYPFDTDERTFKSVNVDTGEVRDLTVPGTTNQSFACGCGYGGTPVFWMNRMYYITSEGGYYDATGNSWATFTVPAANQRGEAAAALLNDRIFMVGSRDTVNTVQAYLPATNTWIDPGTTIANYPFFVRDASAGAVGTELFVMGGNTSFSAQNKMAVYSTTTNIWTTLPDMPFDGYQGDVVESGGKLYVLNNNQVYPYDAANRTWGSPVSAPAPGNQYHLVGAAGGVYVVFDGADGVTVYRYNLL